jgi:hypothetical protein
MISAIKINTPKIIGGGSPFCTPPMKLAIAKNRMKIYSGIMSQPENGLNRFSRKSDAPSNRCVDAAPSLDVVDVVLVMRSF